MLPRIGVDRYVPARYVIGAGALPHIYLDLVGREYLPADWVQRMEHAELST
jgi:hypothetical protein